MPADEGRPTAAQGVNYKYRLCRGRSRSRGAASGSGPDSSLSTSFLHIIEGVPRKSRDVCTVRGQYVPEPRVFRDQVAELIVRVEPAGIGKDPDRRLSDGVRLRTGESPRVPERRSIGADPEHGQHLRTVTDEQLTQSVAAAAQLLRAQLVGPCGGTRRQVGAAEPVARQQSVLVRREQPIGEARAVQRRPEAVARTREVVANSGRVEAGIDAAEEDSQTRRDDVRDARVPRRGQLLACRPAALLAHAQRAYGGAMMHHMTAPSYVHGASGVPLLGEAIGDNLRRTVERHGDREALVARHQGYRATYGELWEQTGQAARGLMARGVGKGDRVG